MKAKVVLTSKEVVQLMILASRLDPDLYSHDEARALIYKMRATIDPNTDSDGNVDVCFHIMEESSNV